MAALQELFATLKGADMKEAKVVRASLGGRALPGSDVSRVAFVKESPSGRVVDAILPGEAQTALGSLRDDETTPDIKLRRYLAPTRAGGESRIIAQSSGVDVSRAVFAELVREEMFSDARPTQDHAIRNATSTLLDQVEAAQRQDGERLTIPLENSTVVGIARVQGSKKVDDLQALKTIINREVPERERSRPSTEERQAVIRQRARERAQREAAEKASGRKGRIHRGDER